MINFISSILPDEGLGALAERLVQNLKTGQKVVWLLSGGSNIALEVRVMNLLRERVFAKELANLTVMLSDERYGPVGHKDSNLLQLQDAGFNFAELQTVRTLTGKSLAETVGEYTKLVQENFDKTDVIVAQLGIGPDGHIAGALPNSVATESNEYVVGYETPTFTRITLTPRALGEIDVAYVFAFGENKRATLTYLRDKDLPISEQPAQVLKKIPEAYIYSDQV